MNALLIYVVKSTICLSLFYGLYALLLRYEAFFRFNRSVLLAIMTLSLMLPLVRLPISEPALLQIPVMQMEEIFQPAEPVPTAIIETETAGLQTSTTPVRATLNIISLAYFAGFFVSIAIALISFASVARVIVTARRVEYRQQQILVSPLKINSFNFAGWIVLSEMDYERFTAEIIAHENIHRQRRHFWDLCFANAISVIHWFNPFVQFLRRELKALHEYEADRSTLSQGIDATRYKLLLIEKAAGASRYSVASGFAQSKIKKRMYMMNKQTPNPWVQWKVLLFIPLAALLALAFARPEIKREPEQISTFKGIEILPEIDLIDQNDSQMAEIEPDRVDNSVISTDSSTFPEKPDMEMSIEEEREEAKVTDSQPVHVAGNDAVIALTANDSIIAINVSMSYGDDKNKHFTVKSSNEQQVVILNIFTRSGNLIFSVEDKICIWNGYSLVGEPMSDGAYFYAAEIRNSSPKISKQGAVYLNNSAAQLPAAKEWEEVLSEVSSEFEKITNRQIAFNGKTIKVKDIYSELPEQYKMVKMALRNSTGENVEINVTVKWLLDYPCIVNEKWETSTNVDINNIVSINTYAADEAVKRYGSRAQNGVIAITTQ